MKINITQAGSKDSPNVRQVDMVIDRGIGRDCYNPEADLQEFEENGLHGLKTPEGNAVFPAVYDKIVKWPDSDVVYTLKGKEYHYYDTSGKEILTGVPEVPGLKPEDDLMPWFITEEQNLPYVIVMRQVDGPVSDRCCLCRGQWVELDRIARKEVRRLMKTDTEKFDNSFTYIYYGYEVVSSDEENPIQDCMEKLASLGCYQSSWDYLTRVCVSPKADAERRENVIMLSMLFFDALSPLDLDDLHHISFGVDDSLAEEEVRVTQIHYFHDRWPCHEELDYERTIIEGSLGDVTAARAVALTALQENAKKKVLKDVMWDFPRLKQMPAEMYKSPDAKETIRKMDWLRSAGYRTEAGIWNLVSTLREDLDFRISVGLSGNLQEDGLMEMMWKQGLFKGKRKKRKQNFNFGQTMEMVKWYVSAGENINILRKTQTPLDVLENIRENFGESLTKPSRAALDGIISGFTGLGARTSKDLIDAIGADSVVGYAYPWVDRRELFEKSE